MAKENIFSDGFITYTVETKSTHELPSGFSFNDWDDGYAAFSNCEKRLKDIKGRDFSELVKDRVTGISGAEGYLMEVDLWRRNSDGTYEEISIEREDRGFLVQQWRLSKNNFDGGEPCYYCEADTQPRSNLRLFEKDELRSMEVIMPEHRLHFFLTAGGGNNGKRQD